ncbi:MAG: hypothetical protein M3T56_04885 [Chloroflexota bacterium]|nr:hypothetical protein [Chloroflexota bacterium]
MTHHKLSEVPAAKDRILARGAAVLLDGLASSARYLRTVAALRGGDPVKIAGNALDSISDVMAHIAGLRDLVVSAAVAAGDLTTSEQRALTAIQRELVGFQPLPAADRLGAMRRALAELRYYGPVVAEKKRAERLSPAHLTEDARKATAMAALLADSLDQARARIQTEFRKAYGHRGRPAGRSVDRASVIRTYRELRKDRQRVTALMVATELGVSDDTVRRVAGAWPPTI